MKKLLLALLLSIGALQASTGAEIYKAKCSMCHKDKGMMNKEEMQSMRSKMQKASKEEKMAMREQMALKMKKSGMRAPAMPMVSQRLKMKLKTREDFIAFVTDYIQNPSKDKGFCMPMAYKNFGTMPPIGKGLTPEERRAVAQWLYDNFKGKWGGGAESKMCEMKNKGMKCGSSKCGASKEKKAKKASKCGAGKCGTMKIETH